MTGRMVKLNSLRISLAILLAILSITGFLYLVAATILRHNFAQAERQLIQRDLQRVKGTITHDLDALQTEAYDYAKWDDTYTFMAERDADYPENNWSNDTLGQEALERLAQRPYDLVLMDCQMPVLDGYETTRQLRQQQGPQGRTIVVAITAHAMPGDREKCLAAGMDDYISKPFRVKDLSNLLNRWL